MVETPPTTTTIKTTTTPIHNPLDSQTPPQKDLQNGGQDSVTAKVEESKPKYSPDTEEWLAKRKVLKDKKTKIKSVQCLRQSH